MIAPHVAKLDVVDNLAKFWMERCQGQLCHSQTLQSRARSSIVSATCLSFSRRFVTKVIVRIGEAMLDIIEVTEIQRDVFAPWIQTLNLKIVALNEDKCTFILPGGDHLVRGGGDGPAVICGQSIAAAADTCSVLTLCALNSRFRNCTTVDITTHFMRPLMNEDVEITVQALSNGRRMAVVRSEFRAKGGKLAATATCAFAYLED